MRAGIRFVFAGSKLREHRERLGLTREALADLTALSPAAIRKLELGGNPTSMTIGALAGVLGVTPNDFFIVRDRPAAPATRSN
jgi:transcriptional regulator with XRE-family HTH domain